MSSTNSKSIAAPAVAEQPATGKIGRWKIAFTRVADFFKPKKAADTEPEKVKESIAEVFRDSIRQKLAWQPPKRLVADIKSIIRSYFEEYLSRDVLFEWSIESRSFEPVDRGDRPTRDWTETYAGDPRFDGEDTIRMAIFKECEPIVQSWFQEGIPTEKYDLYDDEDLDEKAMYWAVELVDRLLDDVEFEVRNRE